MNDSVIDKYFYIWALVLPITSFLIIPSIQGTTGGFLFALFSIFSVPFLSKYKVNIIRYYYTFLTALSIIVMSILLSQLSLSFSVINIDITKAVFVNPFDHKVLFRSSIFTQTLYLLAGIATFSFVRVFYNKSWDKYILAGGMILAVYGLYEFVFFLLTGKSGDFISNRTFGDGTYAGSVVQLIQLGPFTLERIKSLTGEPSMYSFSIFPFLLFAVYLKKKLVSSVLLLSLILSSSTTFFIGIILVLFFSLKYILKSFFRVYLVLWVIIIFYLFVGPTAISSFFDNFIWDKLTMQNRSGSERYLTFLQHINFYDNLPFLNKLFGIGFGNVRSTDMFSTLLVNTGIVGFVMFSIVFLYPIFKLGKDKFAIILKLSIIETYFSMMIAVPEFSYLPTWLFLGIAYNKIYVDRKEKVASFKK